MSRSARRRVLLVEDYDIGLEAATLALTRAGFEVVAAARSRSELEVAVVRLAAAGVVPDAAVTDLELPDSRDAEIVRRLARLRDERWPHLCIVVHSRSDRPDQLVEAFDAGASGFCSKYDEGDLLRVLTRALDGHLEVSSSLAGHLLAGRPVLTPRQQDVLSLLAEGFSNREIAERLDIAEKTVENHLLAIRAATPVDEQPGSSVRVKLTNWWHTRGGRAQPGR